MIIAERRGVVQSIEVTSGASQVEAEITGRNRSGFVCSVSVVLTEQEAIDLGNELLSHASNLKAARNQVVIDEGERLRIEAVRRMVDLAKSDVRIFRKRGPVIEPHVLAAIPEFDVALGECE